MRRPFVRLAAIGLALAACQAGGVAPTATAFPSPTPSPTEPPLTATPLPPTAIPIVEMATPSPSATETAAPTSAPTSAATAALTVELPAGASAAVSVDASALLSGAYPLSWRVRGLPSGVSATAVPGPVPGMVGVWLQSECGLPAGTSQAAVEAAVAETFVVTRISLTLSGALTPTESGMLLAGLGNSTDAYSLRRGGPSTQRIGPGVPLTFCRSQAGRTLTALISEVQTANGRPLSPFPALTLTRAYGWPPPRALQTTGLGANATDVVFEDSGRITWTIAPGNYALTADVPPVVPAERRPYTITLLIDIR